jgi:hypothetical protein
LSSEFIFIQTKIFLKKKGEQEGKTGPVWGWHQWEDGRYQQRV